jgi:hypothetical protein
MDVDQNIVTVGGSTRISQLIDVLHDAGKELRMTPFFLTSYWANLSSSRFL